MAVRAKWSDVNKMLPVGRLQLDSDKSGLTIFVVVATGIILSLALFDSPGTGDKNFFIRWGQSFLSHGARDGYALSADYPPLAMALSGLSVWLGEMFSVDPITSIRLANLFFLTLTSLVLAYRFRSFWAAAGLWLLAVHGALGLLSIDIWFGFFLVFSLIFLEKGMVAMSVVFFAVSCLVKWQPLIIAPFLVIYVWRICGVSFATRVRTFSIRVVAPFLIVWLGAGLVFGFESIIRAFISNLSTWVVSGNAANAQWILTWWLRVKSPEKYGGTDAGIVRYLEVGNEYSDYLRLIFWLFWILVLVVSALQKADLQRTILLAVIGSMAYFVFNVGVHVGHLFLAGLLATFLYSLDRRHAPVFFSTVVLLNVGQIIFYGAGGIYNLDRVFLSFDLSVAVAALHVVIFFWLLASALGQPASWVRFGFFRSPSESAPNGRGIS